MGVTNGKAGSNGQSPVGGVLGAGLVRGKRAGLNRICKLAEAGTLAVDQIPGAIKMAQIITESPTSTDRDRLAAIKLFATFAKLGFDADVQEDKMHRLDTGQVTDIHGHIPVEYGEEGRQWSR
jgi:hypothetical protein